MASDPPDPHSLADHAFGSLSRHEHGEGEFDHDHDSDFYLDANSRSLESVDLVSVGVDIGSSSAQVAFSKLTLRGPGEHRALRGRARDRQTLYLSPVAQTPFRDDGLIDESRLRGLLARSFAASGLTPDEIETGAVVLTGEAATRANAERISRVIAEDIGEFVCAAAGHRMEAMLAAYGSGAVALSRAGGGQRILLIDIGGATTKFARIEDGNVVATAALAVGGRLIVVDRADRLVRIDPAGATWAARAGYAWEKGDTIDPGARQRIGDMMADAIVDALSPQPGASTSALFLTEPLATGAPVDLVAVSGGVGEYTHGKETRDFGDLGIFLGRALRKRIDAGALAAPLAPAGECIRATVLGASEFSMQLSGETIYISAHAALLPARDLPVLRPTLDLSGEISAAEVASAIRAHRVAFELAKANSRFALALPWRGSPDYARVRALCEGVAEGLADMIGEKTPLYMIVEGDLALTIGGALKRDMGIASELLVVDGVVARDFDYADIGRLRMPSQTVPVTIKSLVFGAMRQ